MSPQTNITQQPWFSQLPEAQQNLLRFMNVRGLVNNFSIMEDPLTTSRKIKAEQKLQGDQSLTREARLRRLRILGLSSAGGTMNTSPLGVVGGQSYTPHSLIGA